MVLCENIQVADESVLLLVGLDLLDSCKMPINKAHDILERYSLVCQIPLPERKEWL